MEGENTSPRGVFTSQAGDFTSRTRDFTSLAGDFSSRVRRSERHSSPRSPRLRVKPVPRESQRCTISSRRAQNRVVGSTDVRRLIPAASTAASPAGARTRRSDKHGHRYSDAPRHKAGTPVPASGSHPPPCGRQLCVLLEASCHVHNYVDEPAAIQYG